MTEYAAIRIVFTLQGLRTCTHSPRRPPIRRPTDFEALALYNSEWQGEGPRNSRATSCERMQPNLGGQDGVVAVSLVLSRPVPRSQSELSAG